MSSARADREAVANTVKNRAALMSLSLRLYAGFVNEVGQVAATRPTPDHKRKQEEPTRPANTAQAEAPAIPWQDDNSPAENFLSVAEDSDCSSPTARD